MAKGKYHISNFGSYGTHLTAFADLDGYVEYDSDAPEHTRLFNAWLLTEEAEAAVANRQASSPYYAPSL